MNNNRKDLHHKVHELINSNVRPNFYSDCAHNLIKNEYFHGVGNTERAVMLPLPKDVWYPKKISDELMDYYEGCGLRWPFYSHYSYSMDYISYLRKVPWCLYIGYAIEGNNVYPAAFFATLMLTGVIEGLPDDFYPEEWVIDPFAIAAGHKPDAYIGVLIPKENECLVKWVESGGNSKSNHPLELYARSHSSLREDDIKYWIQIMETHKEFAEGITKDKMDDAIKWLTKS